MEWHVAQGLSNADGLARRSAYGTFGTPTVWFDAEEPVISSLNAYSNYRAKIDAHLAVSSPITVSASTSFQATEVAVSIEVTLPSGETFPDVGEYRVRAILYEDEVMYCCDTQGGDIFRHVGRSISSGQALALTIGQRAFLTETLTLDPAWDVDRLRVVAFVEHLSGNIVTSARAADAVSVEATSWGSVKALYR